MQDLAAMRLRVPLRYRVGRGDPNAAADIAQKIVDAARIADLILP
jgi:hypothetical protein